MDYWIAIDRQKTGPLSLDRVRELHLQPDTLVWHQGLPTWRRADQLPELADSLAGAIEVAGSVIAGSDEPTADAGSDAPESGWASEEIPDPNIPRRPPVTRITQPATPPQYVAYHRTMPQQAEEVPQKPPTYLGWNIAALILCCLIPAIFGIVYSSKVTSRYNEGDYKGAEKASERAGLMLILSIVIGLVWLPFSIVLQALPAFL